MKNSSYTLYRRNDIYEIRLNYDMPEEEIIFTGIAVYIGTYIIIYAAYKY